MSEPRLPDDARARLPREPYPGLRPFLDFEAALLFGRERQVREVIERLKETQFVAVLGGSGSGKSSLIHAGVVPELRSFGIPGAGDLWLPLTVTPGTNVSAEDQAAGRHSPITRLARRFAALLRPAADAKAEAERSACIAEVLRQEAGLARLMDAYAAELAVPPGPDPADARVLFVLDQFEEVFHPTNKGVVDASLLVERVLDHFFNPHPHVHVILTMRSEHLNDCAAFLELPDAINKSSYLIRRLDDDELRGAITGPAQRFLRLHARSADAAAAPGAALPPEVAFEPAVVERMLRDVKAIAHDPDHLPLLQHLLARLWEAALEREEMDMPVPSRIGEIDLVRAVAGGRAGVPGDEKPLDEGVNTLRACVENWPESIYQWHGPEQRAQLDGLFRHLAIKDPNTGLYSQQRIDVDACAAFIGSGKSRADLKALLSEGFLGSVDYLFWDDDDPSRVTLKVSHESFIRGWSRFRRLIDQQAEQFDEFVGILRKCAVWSVNRRSEDFLLETGDMRLMRESDFQARLARPGQRDAWLRLLQLDRDGPRLAPHAGVLDEFLAQSVQRQQQRESSRTRRRWGVGLSLLSLLLVPPAFFSVYVQIPITQRAEMLLDAGNRANRAALTTDYPGVGAAAAPLASLMRAATLIDEARAGRADERAHFSQQMVERFDWIAPVRHQGEFLDIVAAQSEPPVNGKLRYLLASAVWSGTPDDTAGQPIPMPELRDAECSSRPSAEPGERPNLKGRLFVAQPAERAASGPLRAVFVPNRANAQMPIALHGASFDAGGGGCVYDPPVLSVPMFLDPQIVLDAGLRYVAYSAAGGNVDIPSVTVQELAWDRVEDHTSRVLQALPRAVVTGRDAVGAVQRAAGVDRVAVVETRRVVGGRTMSVGGEGWRMLSPQSQRLFVRPGKSAFEPLRAVAPDSPCAKLVADWSAQPGFRTEMFEHGRRCFAITRGNPDGSPPDEGESGRREQVLVAVYERPTHTALARLAENPPAPLASLAPFGVIASSDRDWQVGTDGEHAGWLAVGGKDSRGEARLLGVPWSTCALWRLGQQLQGAGAARDDQGRCEGE